MYDNFLSMVIDSSTVWNSFKKVLRGADTTYRQEDKWEVLSSHRVKQLATWHTVDCNDHQSSVEINTGKSLDFMDFIFRHICW